MGGRERAGEGDSAGHLGDPPLSLSGGGWDNRERVQSNHKDHDDDDGGGGGEGGVDGGESGSLSRENGDGAGSGSKGGGCGSGGDRSFCGLSVGTADDEVTSGHVAEAWRWFESVGTPKFWLAPMVGHSDPAFRMLARSYGANICHTEMIDSGGYACNPKYRAQWDFPGKDRPLVVQLGGSNVEHLAAAASLAALHCDAVELNVGCPQRCARKGGYVMDTPEHLGNCVKAMASAIRGANPKCACLVKIRCFEDVSRTVSLAKMLVRAGCHCLTVHGRTRHQGGGKRTGKWPANFEWIRAVKAALPIPVISNGNVRCYEDLVESMRATGCDGVMSGCGALKRPFIFSPAPEGNLGGDAVRRVSACLDYIRIAEQHPPFYRVVSKHLTDILPARLLRVEGGRALGRAAKDLDARAFEHNRGMRVDTCPAPLLAELKQLLDEALALAMGDASLNAVEDSDDEDEEA